MNAPKKKKSTEVAEIENLFSGLQEEKKPFPAWLGYLASKRLLAQVAFAFISVKALEQGALWNAALATSGLIICFVTELLLKGDHEQKTPEPGIG